MEYLAFGLLGLGAIFILIGISSSRQEKKNNEPAPKRPETAPAMTLPDTPIKPVEQDFRPQPEHIPAPQALAWVSSSPVQGVYPASPGVPVSSTTQTAPIVSVKTMGHAVSLKEQAAPQFHSAEISPQVFEKSQPPLAQPVQAQDVIEPEPEPDQKPAPLVMATAESVSSVLPQTEKIEKIPNPLKDIAMNTSRERTIFFNEDTVLYVDRSRQNTYEENQVKARLLNTATIHRIGPGKISFDGFQIFFEDKSIRETYPLQEIDSMNFYSNCFTITKKQNGLTSIFFIDNTVRIKAVLDSHKMIHASQ